MFIRRHQGFTLIEVLIALAVVGILSLGLSQATQQILNQQQRLEQKTWAHWVAMNQWAALQSAAEWPALGIRVEQIDMAEQLWQVKTQVEASEQAHFRLIHIHVGIIPSEQSSTAAVDHEAFHEVAHLRGLLGEPLNTL